MAQNITIAGATYSAVPSIECPKQGGGTAVFADPSGTTAVASDVTSGKYFLNSSGILTAGTGTGGGATIATKSVTVGSSNATSIQFTSLAAKPKMFAVQVVKNSGSYLTLGSTRYITSVITDGTSTYSTTGYRSSSNGREYVYTTCTWSYSSGTLTVTSAGSSSTGYFCASTEYRLIYAY